MEQTQFQCTGDCLQCSQGQRLYCSSQHAYHSMRMLSEMREELRELKEKVDAMQESDEGIFNPLSEPVPEAQEGEAVQKK